MKYSEAADFDRPREEWDLDEAKKRVQESNVAPPPTQPESEPSPATSASSLEEGKQGPVITPGDVARTTEEVRPDAGIVTQIGEGLGYLLKSDGATADVVNAAAAGLNQLSGGRLQGLDDGVLGSEETKARQVEMAQQRAEKRAAGEMNTAEAFLDTTRNAVTGLAGGIEAGIALPFTIAGRIANQDTPWAEKPEVLINSPVGDAVFDVTKVLVPTLMTGGIGRGLGFAGKATGLTALAGESAIETAQQRAADDLILGQQVASGLGDIANYLGYDGNKLTEEMMRGDTPQGQSLVAVVGFIQNLGINFGVNKVLDYFTTVPGQLAKTTGKGSDVVAPVNGGLATGFEPGMPRGSRAQLPGQKGLPTSDPVKGVDQSVENVRVEVINDPTILETAKILDEPIEKVAKAVDDVQEPMYRADAEPTDVIDADTAFGTAKKTPGNQSVSEEAFIREVVRGSAEAKKGIGAVARDGLTDSQRSYFTNWKAITNDDSLAVALEELTRTYKRLRQFPEALQEASLRAKAFWMANKGLLTSDVEAFAKKMYDSRTVVPVDKTLGKEAFDGLDWKRAMREEMAVSEEGFTVMALATEQLGVQMSKMGRMINNLEFGGVDFTRAMDTFVDYSDKLDLIMVPLRRAKAQWALDGFVQQTEVIKKATKWTNWDAEKFLKRFQGDDNLGSGDFSSISLDDGPGWKLRDLWDAFKAGDQQAGDTLKAYVNLLGTVPPSQATTQMRRMNAILKKFMKDGNKEALRSLNYSSMLYTTEPLKAAALGGIAQMISQPLGNIAGGLGGTVLSLGTSKEAKKQIIYGLGQAAGFATGIRSSLTTLGDSFMNNKLIHASSRFDDPARNLKKAQLEIEFAAQNRIDFIKRSGEPNADWQVLQVEASKVFQLAMASPLINAPQRALQALDQSNITMVGNMEAMARGFVKAQEDGKFISNLNDYVNASQGVIFEDGLKTGRITDGGVLEAAKGITFQKDIPIGDNANFGDNVFSAINEASNMSGVIKWYAPFVRVSYNALDKIAMMEPSGLLTKVVPRYRKIMSGELGEPLQMQLKSGIAFSRLSLMGMGGMALNGNLIGHNPPPGMEKYKQSFIFPYDNEDGFIAIPYDRLFPFNVYLSAVADTTLAVRNNVIDSQQYERAIGELLMSMGMNTLQQSFMTGLAKFNRDLNPSTMDKGIPALLSEVLTRPVAFGRQAIGVFQPYQTESYDSENQLKQFGYLLSQRMLGGVGNPVKYDRYTGRPIPKNGFSDDGGPSTSYWAGVGYQMLNMVGFTGGMVEAPGKQGIFNREDGLGAINYDTMAWDKKNTVRDPQGQIITLEKYEQTQLDRFTGSPEVGNLAENLEYLFSTKAWKSNLKDYKEFIASNPGDNLGDKKGGTKSTSGDMLDRLNNMVDGVYETSRQIAIKHMLDSGEFPELNKESENSQLKLLLR